MGLGGWMLGAQEGLLLRDLSASTSPVGHLLPWAARQEEGCLCVPLLGHAAFGHLLPLGSSACLASLRSAAAKLEDGAAWDSALLVAGLPLATRAPLSGEGVRGLTVAVVLVAVESIPSEGDLGSWLMPETGKEEPEVTQRAGAPSTRAGSRHAGEGLQDRAEPARWRGLWAHGSASHTQAQVPCARVCEQALVGVGREMQARRKCQREENAKGARTGRKPQRYWHPEILWDCPLFTDKESKA